MIRHFTRALAVLAVAAVTHADTFHVYDGQSIQTAIDGASGGDLIVVHPGTYPELIDFAGKAIMLRSSDGPEVTTIDGNGLGSVVTCNAGEGSGTILRGFTITGGQAHAGGGMFVVAADPIVVDCVFFGNTAGTPIPTTDPRGGGMYLENSSATVVNCAFLGNTAAAVMAVPIVSAWGGGIAVVGGAPTVVNCTFNGNRVSATTAALPDYVARAYGGGIANFDGNPTVTNCTLCRNTATASPTYEAALGAGVCSPFGGTVGVANSIFHDNDAGPPGSDVYGTVNVTYSCAFPFPVSGTGNIFANPALADAAGPDGTYGTIDDDVHLQATSPCIDAGDNAAVPLDVADVDNDGYTFEAVPLDLDWHPRFVNDPNTTDTGSGTPPLIDMGADEFAGFEDCNTNGMPDLADIATGTSEDCNGNGIPDECEQLPVGTLYVDDSATAGLNGGSSWTDAHLSLADALAHAACSGAINEIRVAGGTHLPGSARTDSFELVDVLAIRGGYAGLALPGAPDNRNIALYETILSGDLNGDDDPADFPNGPTYADNSYHVVRGDDTSATAVLDGVTITAGNANDGYPLSGGGMYSYDGSPTLANCTFTGNSAQDHGGGMRSRNGSPTLTDCTFDGNWAVRGGGMSNYNCNSSLTNCIFRNNTAQHGGGGMSNLDHPDPTLTNCTFTGNSATYGGGMRNGLGSSPNLINGLFSGNSADYGGGIYNIGSSNPTLANCTLSGNSANYGGGMYCNDGSPELTNCIVWANTAPNGPQFYGGSTIVTFSCIQGGWTGAGNIDADPLFVDADGPDDVYGTPDDDVHLQEGSPCVNAGHDEAVPGNVTTDYEGDTRILHCRVDMGVDETFFIGPDCNENDVSDACDLDQGTSPDCNSNGIPDECDLDQGTGADCNSNGVPDSCDLSDGTSADCNTNGIPDSCDIADGTSPDCNTNMIPDECEQLPAVVYVDDSASGLNDGSSWINAHLSLADAQAHAACSGLVYEIRVAGGTYRPGAARTDTFQLANGLAIRGGYAGLANPGDPDARDVSLYETMLSGDLNGDDLPADFPGGPSYTDNSFHVVTGSGTNDTAVLEGVTITAGNADGAGPNDDGGGMYNRYGSPALIRCTFSGNAAGLFGGGIFNDGSSPELTDCSISGNSASYGGGIYNQTGSNPTLTNCDVGNNSVSLLGGGIYNFAGSPTLSHCTLSDNSGATGGGGMANFDGSTPTLTHCTFRGNESGVLSAGGGVYNSHSDPALINCLFSGNTAGDDGGGMINSYSDPALTNCTFSGNSAIRWGGAMYNSNSNPTLTNCIVWGNTAPTGPAIHEISSTTTATYSCIQGGWTGEGNLAADPEFVDADGLDDTFGTEDDDPRLQAGSQAINAGSDVAPDLPDTDLDGHARILCDDVDLGVYEFGMGDYDCDDDVDLADFAACQICLTGPSGGPYPTGCESFDVEYDGDVDLDDYVQFSLQFAGPQ